MPVLKPRNLNPKKIAVRLRMNTSRVRAFLWLAGFEEPISGFCFFSDLTEVAASFYMSERVPIHHIVQISFESEEAVAYRGVVAWCRSYCISGSNTLKQPATYRVNVKMRFGSEAERRRYLSYTAKLNERVAHLRPGLQF